MKIYFKNNQQVISVSQEVVEVINKQLLKGCKEWQTFSNTDGKVFLIINLSEVAFIG